MQQFLQGSCSQRGLQPFRLHGRCHGLFGLRRSKQRFSSARRSTGPMIRVEVQQVVAQQKQQQASSSGPTPPAAIPVRFMLQRELPFGQSHVLVGSHPFLGEWNVQSAAQMTWSENHIWQTEVLLPAGTSVEFKCVRVIDDKQGGEEWESGENHAIEIPASGAANLAVAVGWGAYATVMTELAEEGSEASSHKPAAAAAAPAEHQKKPAKVALTNAQAAAPATKPAGAAPAASAGQAPAKEAPRPVAAQASASAPAAAAAAATAAAAAEPAGQPSQTGSSTMSPGSVLAGLVVASAFAYIVAKGLVPDQVAVLEQEALRYAAQLQGLAQSL